MLLLDESDGLFVMLFVVKSFYTRLELAVCVISKLFFFLPGFTFVLVLIFHNFEVKIGGDMHGWKCRKGDGLREM